LKEGKKAYKDILRERERFLDGLKVENKDDVLFELEMLLKALDRFFNPDNLPISNIDDIVSRNFAHEIRIVKHGVDRAIFLIKSLIPLEESSAIYFRNYVERELLQDYARDILEEKSLSQETPGESLPLLCLAFLNISEILSALCQRRYVGHTLFHNMGQILGREIAMNRWFNPFKFRAFLPRFDRITNPKILRVVKSVKDEEIKRNISIIFLAFYRLLRELHYIHSEAEDKEALKSSLLIFSLVHSEAKAINLFLEKELPFNLRVGGKPRSEKIIKVVLSEADSVSFQLGMELKKLFKQILKDVTEAGSLTKLKSAIDSSKGILTNFFQQAIVTFAHALDERVVGKDIFSDYISKLEQSLRLREDIWLFNKILENAETTMDGKTIKAIKDFIIYFQSLAFPLVRYSDHDDFQRFCDSVSSYGSEVVGDKLAELKKTIQHFRIFLETTLGHINNRSELAGVPLDETHARNLFSQFL